tara:strand:+ start:77 stop:364 length:288 start_codon:yes stop_codon:yes gene_type:complete
MQLPWNNNKTNKELIIDWLKSLSDGQLIASHNIQQECLIYVRNWGKKNALPSTIERAWRALRNDDSGETLQNHGIVLKPNGIKYGENTWTLKLST